MEPESLGKFLLVLSTCAVSAAGLIFFHRHCVRRFQYPIFSPRLMLRLSIGVLFIAGGGWAFSDPMSTREGLGYLLSLVGGLVVWWSLSQNFIRTNLLHGAIATVLQLILIAVFGPAAALLGLSLGGILIVVFSVIVPVFVVSRRNRASA